MGSSIDYCSTSLPYQIWWQLQGRRRLLPNSRCVEALVGLLGFFFASSGNYSFPRDPWFGNPFHASTVVDPDFALQLGIECQSIRIEAPVLTSGDVLAKRLRDPD